jgi:hypothetical protein
MPITPEEARRIGRRGGLTTMARHDGAAIAAHARRSGPNNLAYFYDEVDPERVLTKSDRDRRAKAAQSLYYSKLRRRPRVA